MYHFGVKEQQNDTESMLYYKKRWDEGSWETIPLDTEGSPS